MDGQNFHLLKMALFADGYEESNRLFRDWFDRSYIANHCCPACDTLGLEPTVLRRSERLIIKQLFGRCSRCGEVHRI
jgi:hypothetical protein